MAILVTPETKVLVQGITGSFGGRHAQLSLEYGSQIVAGVTPGKGGQTFEDKVPVFDTVAQAVAETGTTTSAVFVPPPFAADAILEGVDAGLDLVVCITEGIPVNDMVKVKRALEGSKTRLIGPNCPWTVGAYQSGFTSLQCTFHLNHVINRYSFGDADYKIKSRVHTLKNGISGEWRWNKNCRSCCSCFSYRLSNRIKHRDFVFEGLSAFTRGHPSHDLRAVFQAQLCVPSTKRTCNTLD